MSIQQYSSTHRKHRGIALVWVAMTLLVIFALGGLMLDWARVCVAGHQLQNAADAAALAGARYVSVLNDPTVEGWRDARQVAQQYAAANPAAQLAVNVQLNADNSDNPAAGSGDDIVIGRYVNPNVTYPSGLFIPSDPNPDAMLVRARKDGTSNQRLALMFGRMFGFNERDNIQHYAIAKIYAPYGSGMIALGHDGIGIEIKGGGGPDVSPVEILNGGAIQVNSNDPDAFFVNNKNVVIGADRIYDVGGHDSNNNNFTPSETTDVYDHLGDEGIVPDPYAGVFDSLPFDTSVDLGAINAPGTYSPGYYSGGIDKPIGEVILLPGVYHLGGVGLDASSNGTNIQGDDILLHIVDTGFVDINGGAIDITGHPDYENIAIFQDNTLDSRIIGNNNLDIDGVVYTPTSLLELGGTAENFGTRAVAERYLIHGDANITIDYQGEPQVAQSSYLVE